MRGYVAAAAVAAAVAGAAAGTVQAEPAASGAPSGSTETESSFGCEATAVRGDALLMPAVPLVTANARSSECRAERASSDPLVPSFLPLAAATAAAETTIGENAGTAVYGASSRVTGLRAGDASSLPRRADWLSPSVTNVRVTRPGVGVLGLRSTVVLGLRDAIAQALAARGEATGDILTVEAVETRAIASCDGTAPSYAGTSQVTGVRVLGREVALQPRVTQRVPLAEATTIVPSTLDPSLVTVDGVRATDPAQRAAVQADLATLAPIAIPETAGLVRLTSGVQVRTVSSLTQEGLRAELSISGQKVLQLTVGEAVVRTSGRPCQASPKSVAEASLQCTDRPLVLIDVLARKGRVRLFGAADDGLVGRRVDILFAGRSRVARATVRSDGTFRTTAPLPPPDVRHTNRARYQAVVGRRRSLDLKLHRRLRVESVHSVGRRATFTGRVVRPLADPVRRIVVKRRITCDEEQTVRRLEPSRDGGFRVTLRAPRGVGVAVYRFQTRVRGSAGGSRTYPTFTLPRAVELDG